MAFKCGNVLTAAYGGFKVRPEWMISRANYLIRNGRLMPGVSFLCATPRQLADGRVFGVDEGVVYEGSYLHHGQRENKSSIVDLFDGDTRGLVTDTGEVVDINGYAATKFSLGMGGFCGHNTGVFGGPSTGDFWIWSNKDTDLFIKGGETGLTLGTTVTLKAGLNSLVSDTRQDTANTRYLLVANTADTPDLQIAVIAQLVNTGYSIAPIYIPTSGSPQTIDTAASDAGTLHGMTMSFENPKDRWLWDLLNGKIGSEIIYNGTFDGTGNINGWVLGSGAINNGGINQADITTGPASNNAIEQNLSGLSTSDRYCLSFVRIIGSTTSAVYLGSFTSPYTSTAGYYCYEVIPTSESAAIGVRAGGASRRVIFDDVTLRKISPATGTLTYEGLTIIPDLSQWQTTGGRLPLIVRQVDATTVADVFYVDQADGKYKLTDGTNTAESPAPYVAGQPSDVEIVLSGDSMHLRMDGVDGTPVPFGGTLLHGTNTVKINMHEDTTRVTNIKEGKT